MLKKIIGIIVLIVIVIAAGLFWHYHRPAAVSYSIQKPLVAVTKAQNKNYPKTLTAIGTVIAPHDVTLMAQQPGSLTGIHFKSGQQVKKGQLLFTIDDTSQTAKLAKAEANLANSRAEFHRYAQLNQHGGVISQEAFDKVKAQYLTDKAAVNDAKQALAETKVTAPFGGTISAPQPVRGQIDNSGNSLSNITQISLGSYVSPGEALVELVDKQHLVVQYALPQGNLGETKLGQAIQATTSAYPNTVFHGVVNYVSPSLNTVNRTFVVRASLENTANKLSPGMLMKVDQVVKKSDSILVIPAISLMMDLQGYHVYTLQHNKVVITPVTVGARHGSDVEILSGLTPGQAVISGGLQKVKEGMAVKVSKS